jgi:superfamily II DNA or RNA helicase
MFSDDAAERMGKRVAYDEFVDRKLVRVAPTGLDAMPALSDHLFPFQKDLVTWALRRGRAAIFADTGLGKTRMQLEWARHVHAATRKPVLILAPLAVGAQSVREGLSMGVGVRIAREDADVAMGIHVTNYDRIHKFDCSQFGAVVLDESSIIKHHNARTLATLLDAFRDTPFKLCATATPSPNDYTELGTHAEFLGICSRVEMLSEFFCHDGGETQVWRLKGHARAHFWRWVASWGSLLRRPSDLGYEDAGYDLPPLVTEEHILPADAETVKRSGLLFAAPAGDLTERRNARRASLSARVEQCAALVNSDDQPWIVWCDLNDESDALTESIRGAVEVRGSQDVDEKEQRIRDFCEGRARVLVSKSSICGFGLNLQFCARMAFVGVTDSWEAHYQAIRRIWRFGQQRECHVHVYASEIEGSVVANLKRKEADAQRMAEELSRETRAALIEEVRGQTRTTNAYANRDIMMPEWLRSEA